MTAKLDVWLSNNNLASQRFLTLLTEKAQVQPLLLSRSSQLLYQPYSADSDVFFHSTKYIMSLIQTGVDFTAPAETHTFNGLLFDMDGSIIDSTNAIVKYWTRIGQELGVDPSEILASSHGRRTVDVLRLYDPTKANDEYAAQEEGRIPKEFGDDAVELPGSRALLDQVEQAGVPWAIVTSGTRPLVTGWLDVMKLAHPKNLVTAEDVKNGKPDPTCYQLGAKKLQLPSNASALVLEDAPAGVRAGKAAGFSVVALATSHSIDQLQEAGADWVVRDMRSVTMEQWDKETGEVKIEISNALRGE